MKINAFTKSYAGRKVLSFTEFEFKSDCLYAIIGANGSGKTTFARCISGIELPDNGKSPVEGVSKVGYLPQKSYAFRMSTRKNIMLGADERTAQDLMDKLNLLPLADKPGYKLSGGEMAKMALARILPRDYDLLVLDEPTAAMDMESTLTAEMLIIRRCRDKQTPILFITHSLQQARRVADEVLFFHKGKLLEYGSALEILSKPITFELQQFLEFYGGL